MPTTQSRTWFLSSAEDKERLRRQADAMDITMAALLRNIVLEWLDRNEDIREAPAGDQSQG